MAPRKSGNDSPRQAELKGYQRKFLRGLAHRSKPVVMVGEAGITPQIIESLDVALRAHELVKVRLLQPEDKRAMAKTLAQRSGSELCGLVGHTAILYLRNPENPRIELPKR